MKNPKLPLEAEARARLRALLAEIGLPHAALIVSLDPRTYQRALEGAPVTLAVRSKVRAADHLLPHLPRRAAESQLHQ